MQTLLSQQKNMAIIYSFLQLSLLLLFLLIIKTKTWVAEIESLKSSFRWKEDFKNEAKRNRNLTVDCIGYLSSAEILIYVEYTATLISVNTLQTRDKEFCS